MDGYSPIYILILIFLVFCSAFFSASETAYTCLNRVRLKNLANEGNKRARRVLELTENYDRLISSILIGNNIVNIFASSLATVTFVHLLGNSGVTVATVVMTVLILLVGEVGPKSIARVKSERIALMFFPVLFTIVRLLTPFNFIIGQWQRLIGKLVHEDEEHTVTEEELITMVEEAESGGEFDAHESELIRSAIEFTDAQAQDILTPRVDVVAIELTQSREEIAQVFAESGYSRLPVYDESIDNIVGILHEKDFFRERRNLDLRKLMTAPICVMPTTRLSVLLKHLQKSKAHMAIVMDEYGGVSGILTLEDILEELVGEIWDEHDEITEDFHEDPDGSTIVSGSAQLEELLERYKLNREYESVTVSGWVLEELGFFPKAGDCFDCENLHVTVRRVDRHRIAEISIVQKPTPEEP